MKATAVNFCSNLANRNKAVVRQCHTEVLKCQFPQFDEDYKSRKTVYPKKVYSNLVNRNSDLAFIGPNQVFNSVGHYGTISIINRLFGRTIARNLLDFAKLIVLANYNVGFDNFVL